MPGERVRRIPGGGPVQFEIGQPFQEEVRIRTAEGRQSSEFAGMMRAREDGWKLCGDCGGAGDKPPRFEICGTCGGLGEVQADVYQPDNDRRE